MAIFACLFIADTTGEYSIYTSCGNAEMMFHVSTLLPFTPVNKQQVREGEREGERGKRERERGREREEREN